MDPLTQLERVEPKSHPGRWVHPPSFSPVHVQSPNLTATPRQDTPAAREQQCGQPRAAAFEEQGGGLEGWGRVNTWEAGRHVG